MVYIIKRAILPKTYPMKTMYLLLVLISIIVISGCSQNKGTVEIVENQTDISLNDSQDYAPQYNQSSQSDDVIEHPHTKHTNTNITDDFNSPNISNYPICNSDSDCDSSFINHSCLKCPHSKFVLSYGCYKNGQSKLAFTKTSSPRGRCTQTHMLGSNSYTVYDSFHGKGCMPQTVFCLVEFEGQEVPTSSVEGSLRVLPLWKQKLVEQSGISEEYFKEHFSIHSSDVNEDHQWNNHTYFNFNVKYYFTIDWLTIVDSDYASIKKKNEADYLENNTIKTNIEITFNHPIEHIIPRSEVTNRLNTCASGVDFDERNLILTDDGKVILYTRAIIDSKANRCKRANIDLESGEIVFCRDDVCAIPN